MIQAILVLILVALGLGALSLGDFDLTRIAAYFGGAMFFLILAIFMVGLLAALIRGGRSKAPSAGRR